MQLNLEYSTSLFNYSLFQLWPYLEWGHQKMLFTWQCFIQSIGLIGLISEYYFPCKRSDWQTEYQLRHCCVLDVHLKSSSKVFTRGHMAGPWCVHVLFLSDGTLMLPEWGERRSLFGWRKHMVQVVTQQLLVHYTWQRRRQTAITADDHWSTANASREETDKRQHGATEPPAPVDTPEHDYKCSPSPHMNRKAHQCDRDITDSLKQISHMHAQQLLPVALGLSVSDASL